MPDSATWAGLAAAFSYPGTGPDGTAWEAALPDPLARRARQLGRQRLEAEHVRLFVNALPETTCPPYASWYRDGRLMGETAGRLQRVYRRWGVDVHDEAPDHLAVQLAFVAALMTAVEGRAPVEAAAPGGTVVGARGSGMDTGTGVGLETDLEARADVDTLLAGLREWTPGLFRRVRAHDRTGFYAEAADLCARALEGAPGEREPGRRSHRAG